MKDPQSLQQLRVLLVEDDDVYADILARVTREAGHEPVIAPTAEAAIQLCQSDSPDFILLDIRLPAEDGYSLAAELRQLCGFRGRIVTLSAFPPDPVRQAEAGIFYHLPKEFAIETVRALMRSL